MWTTECQARLLSRTLFIRSQGVWMASGPFGEMISTDLMLLTHLAVQMESVTARIGIIEGESGGCCVSILSLSDDLKEWIVDWVADGMNYDIERMD